MHAFCTICPGCTAGGCPWTSCPGGHFCRVTCHTITPCGVLPVLMISPLASSSFKQRRTCRSVRRASAAIVSELMNALEPSSCAWFASAIRTSLASQPRLGVLKHPGQRLDAHAITPIRVRLSARRRSCGERMGGRRHAVRVRRVASQTMLYERGEHRGDGCRLYRPAGRGEILRGCVQQRGAVGRGGLAPADATPDAA